MNGWHEVREYLAHHPELRRTPHYSLVGTHPLAGHCYVACEALYHLGAREDGWLPHQLHYVGLSHWYLARGDEIADPTSEQFAAPVPYARGRGRGFLTGLPSKRAQRVLDAVKICAPA